MNKGLILAAAVLTIARVLGQSTVPSAGRQLGSPQGRDITVMKLGSPEQLKSQPTIPRGYAVVIGISNYKNLPREANLTYPERDAENIYNTLISKEGGNIEFENVKKLTGPEATEPRSAQQALSCPGSSGSSPRSLRSRRPVVSAGSDSPWLSP